MSKNKEHIKEHDDGSYVVKKSKRSSVIAFIICLLIAFVIWAYASATENDMPANGEAVTQTVNR